MEVKNRYVCKRLRLLSYLHKQGFTEYDYAPDFKNPAYNVFFFDRDVPGFEEALQKYFEQYK